MSVNRKKRSILTNFLVCEVPKIWSKYTTIINTYFTHAVFTVGMSKKPLLPVVVISRAGASLLLALVPSFKDTEALKTVAKKSHPFVPTAF